MTEYTPQAWRFNADGFYADQYAQSTARLGIGIDYQDEDYDRFKAEFLADLAAHDAEVRASVLTEQGKPEWEWGTALRQRNGEIWDHETNESEEDAREHHRMCLETPDDYAPDECIIVRRTPGRDPGPWLAVEEGETP